MPDGQTPADDLPAELPPAWAPGRPAKGLWLPDMSIVTWQTTPGEGFPSHDQGVKLMGVDLVECVALFIRPDGRLETGPTTARDALEAAALKYDARLWFSDVWDFG